MITISEIRERVNNYFDKEKKLPDIIYLNEEEYKDFFRLITPPENFCGVVPNGLWFSGIPVVKEGDKRNKRQIIKALKDREPISPQQEIYLRLLKRTADIQKNVRLILKLLKQ